MRKSIRLFPYLIVSLLMFYTWFVIFTTDSAATIKHYIALSIFVLNLAAYYFRFNYGLLLTGFLLLLASFNAIALLPDIVYTSYFVRIGGTEIETPAIQGRSLLLLILFLCLNVVYLFDQYDIYKSSRMNRK